jgi:hypothetical protein
VATDDGDLGLGGVLLAGELLGEGLGADNVEGGDTEETAGVEDAGGLEDLSGDGDGGVDGVGDDADEGLGAELGNALDQVADDAGVDLEQVVTGHAGLAGNAGGDNDDVSAGQGILQAVVFGQETGEFLRGQTG